MSREESHYGWLDAKIFVHALFLGDPQGARCRSVLGRLLDGTGEGFVGAVTVHELTYVLPRVLPEKFSSREDVCDYLLGYLTCDAVLCDGKPSLIEALRLWAAAGGRFGDARILALAQSRGMPVCTVNEGDFPGVRNAYPADRDE